MSILNANDTIGLISCSNGLDLNMNDKINSLVDLLNTLNINVNISNSIYRDKNGVTLDAEFRAKELNKLYKDTNIKAIFDLSGGDLCNEVLDYLNYTDIKKYQKPFIGYSDLTVLLNAIYKKTSLVNYNYQLRNLVRENSELQQTYFINTFLKKNEIIDSIQYKFIKGDYMEGVVVGGNIRCFLKLAGTDYMPSLENKILFLEALSGDINKISTFLAQYKQLKDFKNIKGLILGTFTEFEKSYNKINIEDYFLDKFKDYDFSIIKTSDLGHGSDSKAIPVGKKIILKK